MKKDIDIGPIMAMMRSAYRLVKIAPFAYSVIYIIYRRRRNPRGRSTITSPSSAGLFPTRGKRNNHSEPHGRLWLEIKQIKQHEKRKETIFTYESSQI